MTCNNNYDFSLQFRRSSFVIVVQNVGTESVGDCVKDAENLKIDSNYLSCSKRPDKAHKNGPSKALIFFSKLTPAATLASHLALDPAQ